jgi:cytoskeletal protein CcmA (bactofilin family)
MRGGFLIVTPQGHRLRHGTVVPKGVRSRDRLEIGRNARVLGSIQCTGSLLTEPGVHIHGDIQALRAVIGANSRIQGDIRVQADLHLLPGTHVKGNLKAEAEVHIHKEVHISGDIHAGGDLIVHGPARTGSIRTGGRTITRYRAE